MIHAWFMGVYFCFPRRFIRPNSCCSGNLNPGSTSCPSNACPLPTFLHAVGDVYSSAVCVFGSINHTSLTPHLKHSSTFKLLWSASLFPPVSRSPIHTSAGRSPTRRRQCLLRSLCLGDDLPKRAPVE